ARPAASARDGRPRDRARVARSQPPQIERLDVNEPRVGAISLLIFGCRPGYDWPPMTNVPTTDPSANGRPDPIPLFPRGSVILEGIPLRAVVMEELAPVVADGTLVV